MSVSSQAQQRSSFKRVNSLNVRFTGTERVAIEPAGEAKDCSNKRTFGKYFLTHLVELLEILRRDDVIRVEIEDVEEEVAKFVLLEISQQISARLNLFQLGDVIRKSTVHPSG